MRLHRIIASLLLIAGTTLPLVSAGAAPLSALSGYDGFNPTATEYLHDMLSQTAGVTVCLQDNTYPLTAEESAALLALLKGAKSAAPRCAPEDCFYLNLQGADGQWLMSLPVQNTPEGIVLLYLSLKGNNAGAPLQNWWQGISTRLKLRPDTHRG